MTTQPALKTTTTELPTENGLLDGHKTAAATALRQALADTFHLFVTTQGIHWNVQGPLFYSIHKLTEEQYEELFTAIDDLAERIRALGFTAPASVGELVKETSLEDADSTDTLEDQIQRLIDANEHIAQSLRQAASQLDDLSDVKTADMMTSRIGVHEKNAWMLRATVN